MQFPEEDESAVVKRDRRLAATYEDLDNLK